MNRLLEERLKRHGQFPQLKDERGRPVRARLSAPIQPLAPLITPPSNDGRRSEVASQNTQLQPNFENSRLEPTAESFNASFNTAQADADESFSTTQFDVSQADTMQSDSLEFETLDVSDFLPVTQSANGSSTSLQGSSDDDNQPSEADFIAIAAEIAAEERRATLELTSPGVDPAITLPLSSQGTVTGGGSPISEIARAEPTAAVPFDRYEAMRELRERGVKVKVTASNLALQAQLETVRGTQTGPIDNGAVQGRTAQDSAMRETVSTVPEGTANNVIQTQASTLPATGLQTSPPDAPRLEPRDSSNESSQTNESGESPQSLETNLESLERAEAISMGLSLSGDAIRGADQARGTTLRSAEPLLNTLAPSQTSSAPNRSRPETAERGEAVQPSLSGDRSSQSLRDSQVVPAIQGPTIQSNEQVQAARGQALKLSPMGDHAGQTLGVAEARPASTVESEGPTQPVEPSGPLLASTETALTERSLPLEQRAADGSVVGDRAQFDAQATTLGNAPDLPAQNPEFRSSQPNPEISRTALSSQPEVNPQAITVTQDLSPEGSRPASSGKASSSANLEAVGETTARGSAPTSPLPDAGATGALAATQVNTLEPSSLPIPEAVPNPLLSSRSEITSAPPVSRTDAFTSDGRLPLEGTVKTSPETSSPVSVRNAVDDATLLAAAQKTTFSLPADLPQSTVTNVEIYNPPNRRAPPPRPKVEEVKSAAEKLFESVPETSPLEWLGRLSSVQAFDETSVLQNMPVQSSPRAADGLDFEGVGVSERLVAPSLAETPISERSPSAINPLEAGAIGDATRQGSLDQPANKAGVLGGDEARSTDAAGNLNPQGLSIPATRVLGDQPASPEAAERRSAEVAVRSELMAPPATPMNDRARANSLESTRIEPGFKLGESQEHPVTPSRFDSSDDRSAPLEAVADLLETALLGNTPTLRVPSENLPTSSNPSNGSESVGFNAEPNPRAEPLAQLSNLERSSILESAPNAARDTDTILQGHQLQVEAITKVATLEANQPQTDVASEAHDLEPSVATTRLETTANPSRSDSVMNPIADSSGATQVTAARTAAIPVPTPTPGVEVYNPPNRRVLPPKPKVEEVKSAAEKLFESVPETNPLEWLSKLSSVQAFNETNPLRVPSASPEISPEPLSAPRLVSPAQTPQAAPSQRSQSPAQPVSDSRVAADDQGLLVAPARPASASAPRPVSTSAITGLEGRLVAAPLVTAPLAGASYTPAASRQLIAPPFSVASPISGALSSSGAPSSSEPDSPLETDRAPATLAGSPSLSATGEFARSLETTSREGPVSLQAQVSAGTAPARAQPVQLSSAARQLLRPITGVDPADVQIRRDPESEALTRAYRADALAVGETVLLSTRLTGETPETLGVIAHELTHVARGRQARFVPPALQQQAPTTQLIAPPVRSLETLDEESLALQVEGRTRALAQAANSSNLSSAGAPAANAPVSGVPSTEPAPWQGSGLPAPWQLSKRLEQVFNPSDAPRTPSFAAGSSQSPAPTPSFVPPVYSSSSASGSAAPPPTTVSRSGVQAAAQNRDVPTATPAPDGPLPQRSEASKNAKTNEPPPKEDLDDLARQIYSILKRRLVTERRRLP